MNIQDFFKIHSTRNGKYIQIWIDNNIELILFRTFKNLSAPFELITEGKATKYIIKKDKVKES